MRGCHICETVIALVRTGSVKHCTPMSCSALMKESVTSATRSDPRATASAAGKPGTTANHRAREAERRQCLIYRAVRAPAARGDHMATAGVTLGRDLAAHERVVLPHHADELILEQGLNPHFRPGLAQHTDVEVNLALP